MYLHCFCRDLLDLNTPPHSWKGVESFHTGDYYEASGFSPVSPVSEVVPINEVSIILL